MKVCNFLKTGFVALGIFSFAHGGYSLAPVAGRCDDDKLSNAKLGAGRNAWAAKCGYIPKSLADTFTSSGLYQVFSPKGAPTVESAPCDNKYTSFGACPLGCYEPTQRLLFNGELVSIAVAQKNDKITTVTTLDENTRFGSEQEIDTFIKGSEKSKLLEVKLANGNTLKVTKNHPLIRFADSKMVVAGDLKSSDSLTSPDLDEVKILSIKEYDYSGDVWNINPKSTEDNHNILSVEGVLTGSNRFQNQWADRIFRLGQRK